MATKLYPYSLTELIQNDDFIAWVLHPTDAIEANWKNFLLDFPKKRQTVEAAREYVILLAHDTGRHPPSTRQRDKMWGAVQDSMQQEHPANQ